MPETRIVAVAVGSSTGGFESTEYLGDGRHQELDRGRSVVEEWAALLANVSENLEHNACTGQPDVVRSRELAEDVGRIFAENAGGDPRTASVAALVDAQRKTAAVWAERSGPVGAPPFSPVSGTDPLPVLGASFSENVQDLDVICGWNADDVSAFTGPGPDTVEITHRMLAEPLSEFRDRLVQAGARACTYRFDWRPRGSRYGATHCVELPLLLGTREAWEGSPMLGDTEWGGVELLGKTLRRIWGRYAHTGVVEPEPALPMAWDPAISHSL
ncbi:hypothetical protein [Rhodococcus wratislaviensis]|uniref:hypothetical protein n=1 Tax=Rhodococcus wratislaviensis TaxID=44752 RepID=UPI003519812C